MPIPALLGAIGLGATAAGSLFRLGTGIAQSIRARRFRMNRPTYNIPDEIKRMLELRQQTQFARPTAFSQAEQNIREGQAGAIENVRQGAGDSAALLSAASASQGTTNRAFRNLSMQENQDFYNRLAGLERAQNVMARFKDKEFQLNKLDPYLEASATRAALTESGLQNISNALGDVSGTAGQLFQMEAFSPGFLNSIFGRSRNAQSGPIQGLFRNSPGLQNILNNPNPFGTQSGVRPQINPLPNINQINPELLQYLGRFGGMLTT